MSALLLGDDAYIDENKRFARREVFVLLRSFQARDKHLREMEAFRAKLPTGEPNVIQFLPDPLSYTVPSYHAAMPYEVKKWVMTRQEVVDVRRFRHPNGLDQSDSSTAIYAPDRYSVRFRNLEQLRKHVIELDQFRAARKPLPPPLNIQPTATMTMGAGFSYMVTLPDDILEWVKGRDEVIGMGREALPSFGDVGPGPEWLRDRDDNFNIPPIGADGQCLEREKWAVDDTFT
ncbi:hypothetical protein C8R43DRAFT_1121736 [Mycena crocata]|nr:hypothetical protein C8R43DRAFT_1121736 [Mycena crocata]